MRAFRLWLPGLAIVFVCGAVFEPLRSYRFIQDDHPIVQRNPIVHRGQLVEIFTTDWWAGVRGGDPSLYRPVTLYSYVLDRGADGRADPGRAHVTNVLLHALAALLVWSLALRMRVEPRAALAAGLLFAVHPLHLAAVAPLTGRAEILALVFSLAALLAQSAAGDWPGEATSRGPAGRRVAAWAAGALVFLALGSKEVAVGVLPLLVLVELLYRRPEAPRGWIARAAALLPAAVALLAHVALRTVAVGAWIRTQSPPRSDNLLVGLEGVELLATRLSLAGRYVLQLVAPVRLSADYSGNVIRVQDSLLAALPLLGLTALAVLAFLVLRPLLARPRRPSVTAASAALAAGLFLAPYVVIGNLFVLVGVAYAERLIYVSSAGFCLLVGVVAGEALQAASRLSRGARRATVSGVGAVLAIAVLLGAVHARRETRHWENEETLFTAAIRATPDSPRAHFTLGKIALDRGRPDDALQRFERTLTLWPTFSAAWFEKGRIHAARGEHGAARDAFRRALEINERNVEARLELARALRKLGRPAAAEDELRAALAHRPGAPELLAELGHVLVDGGRYGEAIAAYRAAIRGGRRDLAEALRRAERGLRNAGAP